MNKIQKTPYDCSLPPGQAAGRVASAVSLLADNKLLITTGDCCELIWKPACLYFATSAAEG